MTHRHLYLIAVVDGLMHPSPPISAEEAVVDEARGFTLKLPDGFVAAPDLVGNPPDIVHAFILDDSNDETLDIMLFVEQQRGFIGRERLKPEDFPPGFPGTLFTTRWRGFELDAFRVPERLGDIATITYNVQIPLKRNAIQLKLFGPTDREPELKRLLGKVLDGLEGESNWTASATPPASVASDEKYGLILMGVAAVIVLGGLIALFLISKISPKGTVLAIAATIYVASWSLEGIRVREVLLVSGAMRMLGFAGGILGIVDLIRKRKPRTARAGDPPSDEVGR